MSAHNGLKFALGTFSVAGSPSFPGMVLGEEVIAVQALKPLLPHLGGETVSMLSLLENWEENFAAFRGVTDVLLEDQAKNGKWRGLFVPVSQLKFYPPVRLPRQVFCVGANYRKHVIDLIVDQAVGPSKDLSPDERRAEAAKFMDERAAHGAPFVFSKAPSAITGPFDPVILSRHARQPDWELELAVIIGKAARRVHRDSALDFIAGYTIVNDITNRDLAFRKDAGPLGPDWLKSKSSPSYLPMGPYLVPAAFVGDPQNLQLKLKLNGQIMQDESTADMLFGVKQIVEFLSTYVQLWPGDLIATGSPAGNGTHYNRFLAAGDVVEGSITGLGTQRNPCIAEEA